MHNVCVGRNHSLTDTHVVVLQSKPLECREVLCHNSLIKR